MGTNLHVCLLGSLRESKLLMRGTATFVNRFNLLSKELHTIAKWDKMKNHVTSSQNEAGFRAGSVRKRMLCRNGTGYIRQAWYLHLINDREEECRNL